MIPVIQMNCCYMSVCRLNHHGEFSRMYLCERACQPDIEITKYHSHGKTEDEEDDSVGVKAEVIVAIVDTTTIESLGCSYKQMISGVFMRFDSCSTVQGSHARKFHIP